MNCDILEHEKRTIETALFPCLIIFPLSFYRFTHTLFSKTLYNLVKLPGFAKLFHFRQIVSDFRQIVYTIWQKNPRTQVRPLPNVKLPLKTQDKNVNFRPMYCQECRIFGLCGLSAILSTGNWDTVGCQDHCPYFN